MHVVDAVVVGAGQAGLGAAKRLLDHGLRVVVLERGRVGETWLSQRWESFALNTYNVINGLPGAPYEGESPDGFMTHIELVHSFEEYVRRFGLDVRTGANVSSVDRLDGGPRFKVNASTEGGSVSFDAGVVVVASGILNAPKIPGIAADLPEKVLQLTTASYRSPGELPDGAVLVVGGGQSGGQIVEDLLEHGRTVFFSISGASRLPRRYRGRDFMDWFLDLGLWDIRTDDVEDPAELTATNPLVSGVGPLGHSISYQYLASRGARLLGRLERVVGQTVHTDAKVLEYIEFADEFSREFKGKVDAYIEDQGLDAPPAEPDPGDDPLDPESSMTFVTELNLDEAGVSTVVWSTGFTADFSWIKLPVIDSGGRPIHKNGVSDVPGLFFIGFPWLSKRKSGVVLGVEEDANRIAEVASAHLDG